MEFRPDLMVPELYQLVLIGILFVCSTVHAPWMPGVEKWLPHAAGAGILICAASLSSEGLIFKGAYRVDTLSQFFKFAVSFGFAAGVLNAVGQPGLGKEKECDYFLFMALSALGLMLLSSCVELITIFLAMELASFSIFPLVPLRTGDRRAAEAAIKYVFFGGAATAMGLFGFSLILASQHTTYLPELMQKPWAWSEVPMAASGLTLFICGLLFKLALFPFHFWAPDVYEGAGNETSAYISTMPKLGAVVVFIRISMLLSPGLEVTTIFALLAALSMTYGNLAALAQRDLKRMLGYSTIAQAGYLMTGLTACTREGASAAAFYAFIYVVMNYACFWVLCRLASDGRNLKLKDLSGLYRHEPGLAVVLCVGAISLAGLPPTAGFMGKLFLLTAAWDHGYDWLVVTAAANVAVSLYYYLNIVRYSLAEEGPAKDRGPVGRPLFSLFWGGLLAGILVVLGVVPSLLYLILPL